MPSWLVLLWFHLYIWQQSNHNYLKRPTFKMVIPDEVRYLTPMFVTVKESWPQPGRYHRMRWWIMRLRRRGPTGQPGPQPASPLDWGRREQPQQPMGFPPGYLPKEHEVGQQDCFLLLFTTIGMARRTPSCGPLCTHLGWWLIHQLHGTYLVFASWMAIWLD